MYSCRTGGSSCAAGMAALGYSASGWLPQVARALATGEKRQRRCIVLWMSGGPSQLDTFDLKPGHTNGGEFAEIDTAVPGLRISEHLPRLSAHAGHLAILRGLSTKEGDHGRGTYLMRTGHVPGGPVRYPTIGASLGKELGSDEDELPSYISIAPFQQFNQAAFVRAFSVRATRRSWSKPGAAIDRRTNQRITQRRMKADTSTCGSRTSCRPTQPWQRVCRSG